MGIKLNGGINGDKYGIYSTGSITSNNGVGISATSISGDDYGVYTDSITSNNGTGISVGSITGSAVGIEVNSSIETTDTGINITGSVSGVEYGI